MGRTAETEHPSAVNSVEVNKLCLKLHLKYELNSGLIYDSPGQELPGRTTSNLNQTKLSVK